MQCWWMYPIGNPSPENCPGANREADLRTHCGVGFGPIARGSSTLFPSWVGESVPGHCTLTPVQLWTLMDYK